MKLKDIKYFNFESDLVTLSKKVIHNLKNDTGVCVIKNFPISENDSALISFSEVLGEPLHEERNIDDKTVYRVEINKSLDIPTYANTENEFWCHTDCSDFEVPPDTVMLLCERPSITGGETFVISVNDLLEKFSNNELFMLSHEVFPLRGYFYPILKMENDNTFSVRYNRASIDISLEIGKMELEKNYLEVINKLDWIINENKLTFRLNSGECLITNNNTILHGRAEFPENSDRLMKRIRLYLY